MNFNNIDEGNNKEKTPFLYRVFKCTKVIPKNGTAEFELEDGTKVIKKYISIADCSYDTIFKSLFYCQVGNLNGTNGKNRIMKFLNSLFFPNEKEHNCFKIRDIEFIKNEIVHFNEKFNKGTIRFDVPCKCFCWDVEMQVKYNEDYLIRFYRYNAALNESVEYPKKEDDNKEFKRWIGVGPAIFDGNNETYELLDSLYYNTYFFNLKSEQKNLFIKKSIKLNEKTIDPSAIAWLKLFSIRQWSKKDPNSNTNKYVIPDDLDGLDNEIKDAINILKCSSYWDLLMAMEHQKHLFEEEGIKEGRKKGIEEGIEKGNKNGERKSSLCTALDALNMGIDLKNFKSLKDSFSKDELKLIEEFKKKPYNPKTFAKKIKLNEKDVLNICDKYHIPIVKRRKLH
ncbi:hypothetical protein PIROE2DRAFT_18385 [Piromyces sp. E2]|nr:hypothetical protein PIROE2DRAFT_18385 [Piromyces sp. E2]|eukprot:OUM56836.1 hypothetical protein PIROE2DRAFT_18385 [Piromyces sp. E2]